jgi:VanZ family protein
VLPQRWRHWALTGPILLGIVDEVTQSLSRNRSADVWDLAADTVGIALVYAVAQWRYPEGREPA